MNPRDALKFVDAAPLGTFSVAATHPVPKLLRSTTIADNKEDLAGVTLGYVIPKSGETLCYDCQEWGVGANIHLVTLPLPGCMITRSQAQEMRQLLQSLSNMVCLSVLSLPDLEYQH